MNWFSVRFVVAFSSAYAAVFVYSESDATLACSVYLCKVHLPSLYCTVLYDMCHGVFNRLMDHVRAGAHPEFC